MRNRAAGIAGGLVLAASAFLPWFRDRDSVCTPCTAIDIPALSILRHVDQATSLRLGYLAVLFGALVVAAAFLPLALRGLVQALLATLALAGVAAFAVQLLREANRPGAPGSLPDYLGYGVVVAALGALVALGASAGAVAATADGAYDDEDDGDYEGRAEWEQFAGDTDAGRTTGHTTGHTATHDTRAAAMAEVSSTDQTLVERVEPDTGEETLVDDVAGEQPAVDFHDAPTGTWTMAPAAPPPITPPATVSPTVAPPPDSGEPPPLIQPPSPPLPPPARPEAAARPAPPAPAAGDATQCRSCGQTVAAGRTFCGHCGFRVRERPPTNGA